jgi:hypothetical protein
MDGLQEPRPDLLPWAGAGGRAQGFPLSLLLLPLYDPTDGPTDSGRACDSADNCVAQREGAGGFAGRHDNNKVESGEM